MSKNSVVKWHIDVKGQAEHRARPLALLLACLVAGCTPATPAPSAGPAPKAPKDALVLQTPPDGVSVFPVAMPDGTKCVAMVGWRSSPAISCDWRK